MEYIEIDVNELSENIEDMQNELGVYPFLLGNETLRFCYGRCAYSDDQDMIELILSMRGYGLEYSEHCGEYHLVEKGEE